LPKPHKPTLKPKLAKELPPLQPEYPPFRTVLGLPTLKKQNKFVLRG